MLAMYEYSISLGQLNMWNGNIQDEFSFQVSINYDLNIK